MKKLLILGCFLMLNCAVSYSTNADALLKKMQGNLEGSNPVFSDTIPSAKNDYEFSNCVENINLNNLESNLSYLYWASNSISVGTNYSINPGSDIKMKAGETIVLKPSTAVLTGSRYLARIEDCQKACSYEIPKGLSPNGDGINDSFDLSGACDILNVKIFNRYGMQIFEKENYTNEWHGQDFNNSELPAATYYYAAKLTNGNVKTGWVYLNR
jgi:gliding motility-associated-like protein